MDLYNRDIEVLLKKLEDVMYELRNCQSSRLHVGLTMFDARRLAEELAHITDHANAVKATDFPETHPVTLATNIGIGV